MAAVVWRLWTFTIPWAMRERATQAAMRGVRSRNWSGARLHLRSLAPDPASVHLIYHGLDLSRFPPPSTPPEVVRDGSTPVINAISFLLIVGTSLLALTNLYFSRKGE